MNIGYLSIENSSSDKEYNVIQAMQTPACLKHFSERNNGDRKINVFIYLIEGVEKNLS